MAQYKPGNEPVSLIGGSASNAAHSQRRLCPPTCRGFGRCHSQGITGTSLHLGAPHPPQVSALCGPSPPPPSAMAKVCPLRPRTIASVRRVSTMVSILPLGTSRIFSRASFKLRALGPAAFALPFCLWLTNVQGSHRGASVFGPTAQFNRQVEENFVAPGTRSARPLDPQLFLSNSDAQQEQVQVQRPG